MKVFLSWSGDKSHKVAMILRDWFPSVIQSLQPYVSSEDIDKGARWSTDIAKELEDSSFGILCVTRGNLNAPWLTFEAGALSKTMDKAFVSPFLFDIKRSEVDGPILQFQSTIFEREDVLKLLKTLNKACGDEKLTDYMVVKAFEVWWPTLEAELKGLRELAVPEDEDGLVDKEDGAQESADILEEILDLSRLNQKLLRNPEYDLSEAIASINDRLNVVIQSVDREKHFRKRRLQRYHPAMIGDLIREPSYIGLRMVLSLYKDEFPWLYDSGLELANTLQSNISREKKREKIEEYLSMVKFTTHHPVSREFFGGDKSSHIFLEELPFLLHEALHFMISKGE